MSPIKKATCHVNQNEGLIFEKSSPGKYAYRLPELDVPEVDPQKALGAAARVAAGRVPCPRVPAGRVPGGRLVTGRSWVERGRAAHEPGAGPAGQRSTGRCRDLGARRQVPAVRPGDLTRSAPTQAPAEAARRCCPARPAFTPPSPRVPAYCAAAPGPIRLIYPRARAIQTAA